MINLFKTLVIVFFLLIPIISSSQNSIIEINNTNIVVPDIHDFGQFNERIYTKFIIKNNRNSTVVVSNINTPAGFFANISDMNIASNKKVILYIGVEPSISDFDGDFEEEIVIKTNLITDIVVKVKGSLIE